MNAFAKKTVAVAMRRGLLSLSVLTFVGVGCTMASGDASEHAAQQQSAMQAAADPITICHLPPGNPSNAHTITIDTSALPAHLAHGDSQGACGSGVDAACVWDGSMSALDATATGSVSCAFLCKDSLGDPVPCYCGQIIDQSGSSPASCCLAPGWRTAEPCGIDPSGALTGSPYCPVGSTRTVCCTPSGISCSGPFGNTGGCCNGPCMVDGLCP